MCNYKGSAESEGGQFHFAACLPFEPEKLKFQEFAKLQHNISNLTAFEQIPEIPAKFRKNFGEKYAI